MSAFSSTTRSTAVVPAPREDIWAALTDPVLLPKLTPLLDSIDAHGDRWTWHMMRIGALGVGITPTFTERMTFDDGAQIDYVHEPAKGAKERAGAQGWYRLKDVDGGTELSIELTVCVELPLPKVAALAVGRVMTATMERTGAKFSANLLAHLGVTAR